MFRLEGYHIEGRSNILCGGKGSRGEKQEEGQAYYSGENPVHALSHRQGKIVKNKTGYTAEKRYLFFSIKYTCLKNQGFFELIDIST
ncbi:hypothetical protein ACUUL3_10860 [Thiovibrio sp. JS02]